MTAWVKQCKFAKCRGVHKSFGVGVQKEMAKGYYQSIMQIAFSDLLGSRHMDETFPAEKQKNTPVFCEQFCRYFQSDNEHAAQGEKQQQSAEE